MYSLKASISKPFNVMESIILFYDIKMGYKMVF